MAESNIIKTRVNDVIDLMVPLYSSVANNGKFKEIPSLMLWGPPGIGKSQGVRALGKELAKKTGKKVAFTDVRLLLFNPVDLRGIPMADKERQVAVWLKPLIFQMDPSPDIINILFLDEISAAPLSVQAAAYQMVLDRVVGEHKLPDNCIVVAAGNRVTDKSVAYKMPKALGNRMTHLEIEADIDDWKRWAIPAGIDSRIIAYLNYRRSHLFQFDASNDDVAFCSPRSWEMSDTYLKKLNSIDTAFPLIAGSIGLGPATEFKAWSNVFHKLPNIQDIFDGKDVIVPKEPDILYALSASLVSHSAKYANDKTRLGNLVTYSLKMPAEFATLTVRDTVTVESVRSLILSLPQWITWSKQYKGFIM
jgi:hypothetical protein